MQTEAYIITKDRVLVPCDASEMSDDWFLDDTVRWIKITSASPEEIKQILRPLELQSQIVHACANPESPQVEVFEKVLFMAMPLWAPDTAAISSLRFACVATTLITIQDEPIDFIEELAKRYCGDMHLLDVNTASLIFHLTETILKFLTPPYLALHTDVETTAEVLENTPGKVETDDLLALKRRATHLSNLLEDYLYCISELREARSDTLEITRLRASFQELVEDIQRSLKLISRIENQIRDLRQSSLNCLQESTNRRLNVLAVLSIIYLPSTLIAGIFGMNFNHIPMVQFRHGYQIVLVIMLGLVVGQVCFFYRRGWLK